MLTGRMRRPISVACPGTAQIFSLKLQFLLWLLVLPPGPVSHRLVLCSEISGHVPCEQSRVRVSTSTIDDERESVLGTPKDILEFGQSRGSTHLIRRA